MQTTNLQELKINVLTLDQYQEASEASEIDENALYLVPETTPAVSGGGNTESIIATNLTINSTDWVSDTTFTDYPYKAEIAVEGLTEDYLCDVFTPDHTNRDLDYHFSPFVETSNGKFIVYGAAALGSNVTIENVSFKKVVS